MAIDMILHFALFFFSCLLLIVSGNWLVKSLSRISEFLGLKEFTVAFILMSFATAAPEMFIGVSSALGDISELSLGNILGQNIIHFTVAVFVCVLIQGNFSVKSKTTRDTAFFSGFMALFPLVLILDGTLSRTDGFALIFLFVAYAAWMIRKGRRFEDKYDGPHDSPHVPIMKRLVLFFKSINTFLLGSVILVIASQGIVKSAVFFADNLDIPLVIIGVLIVGLGTALPEVYFSAYSAKRGDGELMAGNLLGATVVSTSLVLGVVSIISPITGIEIFSYLVSRLALFVSVSLFIYFMMTGREISRKEGWVLLGVYLAFVAIEIFSR